ncbi:MAG: hypothetical protein RLZZ420_1729 [Bacteroidota bacterium]
MMKFFINPVMTSNRLRSSRLLLKKETIMDIRELIRKAFNEDLPISGGMGNSIEEAVILESAGPMNDYLTLEYQVMDLIAKGRDVSWELNRQSLVVKDDRKYDKLEVAVKGINGNPIPLRLEYHYYDITKCVNMLSDDNHKNDEKMVKMKLYLDQILLQMIG